MLRWRLLSAAFLIAIAVSLAYLDYRAAWGAPPGLWMLPLFIAAVFLGTQEMLDLLAAGGYHPVRWPVFAGTMAVALAGCAPLYLFGLITLARLSPVFNTSPGIFARFEWFLTPTGLVSCVFAISVSSIFWLQIRTFDGKHKELPNLLASVFIIGFIGVQMALIASLRYVAESIIPLLSTLVIVKASDAGAYFSGRFLGRNKFSPLLSPKKTWEGTLGGVLTAGLVSLMFFTRIATGIDSDWQPSPEPGIYVGFGCVLGIIGIVGDLSISLVKREMEVKDSGQILPGLGGMLDVLDSLMPSAVVSHLFWMSGFFTS